MRLLILFLASVLLCGFARASDEVRFIPLTIEASTDSVRVSGRWITKQSSNSLLLAETNATEIVCLKKSMSCTEALAVLLAQEDNPYVSGRLLISVLSQYVVESWTDSEIIAKSEKKVADVTLRIDLLGQAASKRRQGTKARGNQSADPSFIVDWQLR